MELRFFPNWTEPVMLITKGWSNPLLENSLRNLGTSSVLYYKYCETYFNTSPYSGLHKKIRKKREIERKDTHTIK